MKSYSIDLREKIALAYEQNDYSLNQVAELFAVGRRTVARFVQKHRTGLSLAPLPHGGGYPAALTSELLSTLRYKVVHTPDATLAELVSYLKAEAQLTVHPSTICRALQRLGLPRKKRVSPQMNETKQNAFVSGSAWRARIAANSSLLMRPVFTWLLRAHSDAPHVVSA